MNKALVSPEAVFLQALRVNKLKTQRCGGCQKVIFFPRTNCHKCGSDEYTWEDMNPGATLYSYSEIPATEKSPARNVVLVDMDDGFRMMSTVPDAGPGELAMGMRLLARADAGAARIVFDPE